MVLVRTRQKLAVYRQQPSPLSSLADFALWVLRSGLPIRRPKFWVVALILAGLVAVGVFVQPHAIGFGLAALFGVVVLVSLLLSYARAIGFAQTALVNQARTSFGESLASMRARQSDLAASLAASDRKATESLAGLQGELGDVKQEIDTFRQDVRDYVADALQDRKQRDAATADVNASLERLVAGHQELWSTLREVASEHDSLRSDLDSHKDATRFSLQTGEKASSRLEEATTALEGEIAALTTRLDSTGGNTADTIEYLCIAIDELRRHVTELEQTRRSPRSAGAARV